MGLKMVEVGGRKKGEERVLEKKMRKRKQKGNGGDLNRKRKWIKG